MKPRPDKLQVYNTLSGSKEHFHSLQPGKVQMYVCGPTVYDHSHIGHARSYVAFDVIRRYLEYLGYDVKYVVNFTDVEDKILDRATREKIDPIDLANKYIESYIEDMRALNVRPATVHPRVTEYIPQIIEMIEGLVANGSAYASGGDVYFDVSSFGDFGKLSHQRIEDMIAGARVEVSEKKRNPLDFTLWKAAKTGEAMAWESPWGAGRPGWHIECSVMAMHNLGETIDIHGGGQDLVFPHHESEIMQSESFTGKPFCRYWLHNGFITVNKEKMSKSLGNFFTIKEILGKYDPETVRFFLLNTHYRKPIDFSDAHLEEARESYQRLKNTLDSLVAASKATNGHNKELEAKLKAACERSRADFHAAMLDDFNTRDAVAALFVFAKEVNAVIAETIHLDREVIKGCIGLFHDTGAILGLFEPPEEEEGLVDDLLKLFIELRNEARARRDFKTADAIRDRLKALGILLEDTKEGTIWKRV